jgi:hypothetical protein
MELKDLIVEFKNHTPKNECAEFIEWFWNNQDLHIDGKVYSGENQNLGNILNLDRKKTKQAYPKPEDPISHLITKNIFSGYEKYSKSKPIPNGQPMCAADYSVRVYYKNDGYFLDHVDQSAGPNVTRVFGIILYLNDVEDNGETEFPDFDYKCKPEAGKLLIFPCNYLFRHQGNVPISEDKYIVTAFINFADV